MIPGGYSLPQSRSELPAVPDPEGLDATRPVDLEVCTICDGEGSVCVPTHDPYDDAWDGVECWSCGGNGVWGAA